MTFLRSCWYLAAWSDEVVDAPFARTILNEPVVIYRTSGGDAIALSDRCPHRFAPLHLGNVKDDRIQCPYHGLEFDREGKCVFNPQADGATPVAARLRKYALIEIYGGLWIWMGDPETADVSLLPDLFFLRPESGYSRMTSYVHTSANYELMSDNILDLSHVAFVHRATFNADEASAAVKPRTRQEGSRVYYERAWRQDRPSPMFAALYEVDEPVDVWSDVIWDAPALMTHISGLTPAGTPREGAREIRTVHFMTPETDRSTHYFWAGTRSFRHNEPDLDARLLSVVERAFGGEDKPMIEAQQAMMGDQDFWTLKPLLLRGDAAGVLARRALAKLIAEESKCGVDQRAET
ncbi:aromatic ring-hydroxylating dioxygenase subunit alpha [Sphingomonas sp. QA11]|uniref:aromatic ring-hydroxylating dioxygenase subunit alpha n=1 Tax=Sphingomonas sp. QA11 TaxID=2950605 RepID=UPI002349B236|nr:aromatic ring-hydroxylating dioxygenase subunit alpha [Sphingomonas sp. QA11]WCM25008.1 aromatic ring-hydroxylating dioxygenase subunit alpha [Sphingomonas sp. QA11]